MLNGWNSSTMLDATMPSETKNIRTAWLSWPQSWLKDFPPEENLLQMPELFSDSVLLQVEGQLLHMYFSWSFFTSGIHFKHKINFSYWWFIYLTADISVFWQFTFNCAGFSKDALFTSENTITGHNLAIRASSTNGCGPRTYFSRCFKGKRSCDKSSGWNHG